MIFFHVEPNTSIVPLVQLIHAPERFANKSHLLRCGWDSQ